jgi:Domain of unknown function (DUF6089)
MKRCLVLLLLISNLCFAQRWEAEIMTGASGYKGDLTEHIFTTQTLGPAAGFNLKYNFNDIFILRGGFTKGEVLANDKDNHRQDLKCRNLNFRTNILEGNLCLEVNLFEPDFFSVYPYVFAGVGVFHFNPYTYDKNGNKTYLQPLGTEGQGLPAYPDRKPYSLTQFCLPFGGGMKINLNKKCDLVYEFAGRVLFTDYLDDVSKTYVNTQTLMTNSRPKTAELAYRQTDAPFPSEGDIRGNPKVKDWYFVTGLKLLIRLGKER